MKKYYKFCNVSSLLQMLIIAKAGLNFNPCSCFFDFKSSVLSKTAIFRASNCGQKT